MGGVEGCVPGSQVRTRLPAGGEWIRKFSSAMLGHQRGRLHSTVSGGSSSRRNSSIGLPRPTTARMIPPRRGSIGLNSAEAPKPLLISRGTGSSNPLPSADSPCLAGYSPPQSKSRAFAAGVRGGAGSAVGRDGRGAVIWRRRAAISLSGQIPVPQRGCGRSLNEADRAKVKSSRCADCARRAVDVRVGSSKSAQAKPSAVR
jgi:hypothetical protein